MAKTNRKNRKNFLRGLAKVVAVLVAADIVALIWMMASEILPFDILGVEFTKTFAGLGVLFDIFLLVVLVHYAWHPGVLEPTISRRTLFLFIAVITGIAAMVHLVRIVMGLELTLGGWAIPMWLSWFGAGVTVFISYTSLHFMKK